MNAEQKEAKRKSQAFFARPSKSDNAFQKKGRSQILASLR